MKLSAESFRKSLDIEDFVESSRLIIQDYKCSLCHGIYNDPVVDTCGHVYCRTCIVKYFETEKACPISGWKIEEGNMSTLVIVNEILKRQSVLCKNRSLNCNWIGKLGELEFHLLSQCSKQPVECPYEQCFAKIHREDVDNHKSLCRFKLIECQYCNANIVNAEIDSHLNVCPLFKIPCPQKCNEVMERKHVDSHIAGHCLHSYIDCPYKDYGCHTKLTRKELSEYMTSNMNKHNLQILIWLTNFQQNILENTVSFKDTLSSLETKVKKLEDSLANLDMANKTQYLYKDNDSASSSCEIVQKKLNKKSISPFQQSSKEENTNLMSSKEKFTNKKRTRVKDSSKNRKSSLVELSEEEKKISSGSSSCSPLYSVKGYTPDGKIKKEHIFDIINISKGIEVQHTRATCLQQNKNEHRFVFANLILNDKDTEWRIIINAASPWIALGMCIKDQVISNRYRFISNSPNFNHSFFGVSSNGYLWNANNQTENNFYITNFPIITKGDIIMFKYLPQQKELYYKFSNKLSGKLTNVYASKGGFLTPCIIFLNPGDEVLLETN